MQQREPREDEIDRLTAIVGRPAHDFSALNDELEDRLALPDRLGDYVGVEERQYQPILHSDVRPLSQPMSLLQEAVRYHRAGQLSQAEALYRQVLQQDSNIAEVWYNLGLIAVAVKNHAVAAQLFSRALALDPNNNTTRFDLAASLKSAGRRAEALALFQETWKREFGPGFASADDSGVRELVRRICTEPIGPWADRFNHLSAYAELIEEQGAFRGLEPPTLTAAGTEVCPKEGQHR